MHRFCLGAAYPAWPLAQVAVDALHPLTLLFTMEEGEARLLRPPIR